MTDEVAAMRTPEEIGYLAWIAHRISAVALAGLVALHIGVQAYPEYGFASAYTWGFYGVLLDLTLGLVLIHAWLGIRSTVLEFRWRRGIRLGIVWIVGMIALALFVLRILG